MSEEEKKVPADWKLVVDSKAIDKAITRISYEILEQENDVDALSIVGIRTGGEFIARRVHRKVQEIEGRDIQYGVIDITLYRDDLSHSASQPTLKGTELNFPVSGSRIVLVDDVLYTGRTIRAALDAIIDFGRPKRVELAVLVDRGHREFPIRPDYVGKNLPSNKEEFVRVRFKEQGFDDGIYLIEAQS